MTVTRSELTQNVRFDNYELGAVYTGATIYYRPTGEPDCFEPAEPILEDGTERMLEVTDLSIRRVEPSQFTLRPNLSGVSLERVGVGSYQFRVDTSDATIPDFYQAGFQYSVAYTGPDLFAPLPNGFLDRISPSGRVIGGFFLIQPSLALVASRLATQLQTAVDQLARAGASGGPVSAIPDIRFDPTTQTLNIVQRADYTETSAIGPLRFEIVGLPVEAGDTVRFGANHAGQPTIQASGEIVEEDGRFFGIIELNRFDHTDRLASAGWRWELEHLTSDGEVSPIITNSNMHIAPSQAED